MISSVGEFEQVFDHNDCLRRVSDEDPTRIMIMIMINDKIMILLGVVHILRNHFLGSRETPPPLRKGTFQKRFSGIRPLRGGGTPLFC